MSTVSDFSRRETKRVQDNVESGQDVGEVVGFVIDDLVRAEGSDLFNVVGTRSSGDVRAEVAGNLNRC